MKIKANYLGKRKVEKIDLEYTIVKATIATVSEPGPPMLQEPTEMKYITLRFVPNTSPITQRYQALGMELRHATTFFEETVLPSLNARTAEDIVGIQVSILYEGHKPIGIVPHPEEATLGNLLYGK